jgi:hypothetical protein
MSKIAVEVRRGSCLTEQVKSAVDAEPVKWRSRNLQYDRTYDLRKKVGISAILHLRNLRTGNHLAELVGSDLMSYRTIMKNLSSIVECDPGHLRIMRVDLSVDVEGYSFDWFLSHARVPHKRTVQIFGKQSKREGRDTNGLYIGDTLDRFRIMTSVKSYIIAISLLIFRLQRGLGGIRPLPSHVLKGRSAAKKFQLASGMSILSPT